MFVFNYDEGKKNPINEHNSANFYFFIESLGL